MRKRKARSTWLTALPALFLACCGVWDSRAFDGQPFAIPDAASDPYDFGDPDGGAASPASASCPYPPPKNGDSCASIDKGRDTAVTCVYDPCGGEADPNPGSPFAFVAVCFQETWTVMPDDASDMCGEPFLVDASADGSSDWGDADLDAAEGAD